MKNVEQLFEREQKAQEIKSNERTMKCFILYVGLFFMVWVLNTIGFFQMEQWLVTFSFLIVAVSSCVASLIYHVSNKYSPWVKYVLVFLVCVFSSAVNALLSVHAILLFAVPLVFAVQYVNRGVMWFSYFANLICMGISSMVSFYYGICDLNILFESNHTRDWYMEHYVDGALQIMPNANQTFIVLGFSVVPKGIVLLAFTFMLHYLIRSNRDDAVRIARLTYSKDMDLSTSLYNKNKYEEMLANYYPKQSRVGVIFMDLNNLKAINDTYGHAVGDEMITNTARMLMQVMDERRRPFRIGGDEFILIVDQPGDRELPKLVERMRNQLEGISLSVKEEMSLAMGYAKGHGSDIAAVIKEADAMMYDDKRHQAEKRMKMHESF